MTDNIEREVGEILSRLRYWQGYAKKAEDHALVLAEQCEALQHENHELEMKIQEYEDHDNLWKHAQDMGYTKVIEEQNEQIKELKKDLSVARQSLYEVAEQRTRFYDGLLEAFQLIEEGLAQNSSLDYDAKALAFIEKHSARVTP